MEINSFSFFIARVLGSILSTPFPVNFISLHQVSEQGEVNDVDRKSQVKGGGDKSTDVGFSLLSSL